MFTLSIDRLEREWKNLPAEVQLILFLMASAVVAFLWFLLVLHLISAGTDRPPTTYLTRCRTCRRSSAPPSARSRRQLCRRPREIHQALAAARAAESTQQWKDRCKTRAGVEGTMAQAAHVTGMHRARYLGLPRTRLKHAAAATAINLIRLDALWTGKPLDRTRTTHLQRLDLNPAA